MALPNLFIAGVPKAGTTSLFNYLRQHPEVCGARPKEPGYFQPLRWGKPLRPLDDYRRHFVHCRSERFVMEATPGYFYGGATLARELRQLPGKVRAIVMLRNPVERLFSFYRYKQSQLHIDTHLNFPEYLAACKAMPPEERARQENYNWWGLEGGIYPELLEEWFQVFGEDLKVTFFDDLVTDKMAFLAEICNWLGLDIAALDPDRMQVENKSMLYRSGWLQRLALRVDSGSERLWCAAPRLKRALSWGYNFLNAKPHSEQLDDETRQNLQEFYAPHNHNTAELLRAHGYSDLPEWLG